MRNVQSERDCLKDDVARLRERNELECERRRLDREVTAALKDKIALERQKPAGRRR